MIRFSFTLSSLTPKRPSRSMSWKFSKETLVVIPDEALTTGSIGAGGGDLASLGDVIQNMKPVAGTGGLVEAGQVDRSTWAGFLDRFVGQGVVHCANATVSRTTDDHIADSEGTVLHHHLGDHTAVTLLFGLQADADGRAIRVRAVLVQFRNGQDRFEQLIHARRL